MDKKPHQAPRWLRFRLRTLLLAVTLAPPLLAYIGSYAVLSRRGYAHADSFGSPGFWFVPPMTQRDDKRNTELVGLYWSRIQLEIALVGKRYPAHEHCLGPELPP